MREETKALIKTKTFRHLDNNIHQLDTEGQWVHVRDLRSIIKLEVELLQKRKDDLSQVVRFQYEQIEKLKS